MSSVQDHYRNHLAPIYAWMAGGLDAAIARGATEIAAILPDLATGTSAVDLGAGFGMHAIPLGRRGCAALAFDTSPLLLQQMREHAAGLPVTAVEDDLLSFQRHLGRAADAILCMGTCFLEYGPDTVNVHDVLHEREGPAWNLRVSAYRKLRLSPQWVCAQLQAAGFSVVIEPGLAGMVRVAATRE